jgi:hypothetical protein
VSPLNKTQPCEYLLAVAGTVTSTVTGTVRSTVTGTVTGPVTGPVTGTVTGTVTRCGWRSYIGDYKNLDALLWKLKEPIPDTADLKQVPVPAARCSAPLPAAVPGSAPLPAATRPAGHRPAALRPRAQRGKGAFACWLVGGDGATRAHGSAWLCMYAMPASVCRVCPM